MAHGEVNVTKAIFSKATYFMVEVTMICLMTVMNETPCKLAIR